MTTAAVALVIGLVAGAPLRAAEPKAQVGQPAPQFTLEDQNGKSVSLADYRGKIVVLEWFNNECPIVQRHYRAKTMATLSAKYAPQGVVWLAINTTAGKSNADNKAAASQMDIAYPVLNDSSGTVGHLYGATNTPNMYIINKDGVLVYKGAIDNDPRGNMSADRVNYVDQALGELLKGEPISTPETKPYGCSVKYAS
jgi:peroxiredoxin